MATIKSFTSLKQSKVLAEILPIGSADMYFEPSACFCTEPSEVKVGDIKYAYPRSVPCWSLSALLDVIPQEIFCGDYVINITGGHINKWVLTYDHCVNRNHSNYGLSSCADTLIDACVEMIVKLHEQNLL